MNPLALFLSQKLTPIEAYTIFSRSFAGERFLLEPNLDDDEELFGSMSRELEFGISNRFFWEQLVSHIPFAYAEINEILEGYKQKPVRKPKKRKPIQGTKKHRLLRDALLAGEVFEGLRNGRFLIEIESLTTDEGTFFEGMDLLHGQPCIFFFSPKEEVYERSVQILELAQLPNRNLVPILDVGIQGEEFYIVFEGGEQIAEVSTEEEWCMVMRGLFNAFDSIQSREIELGGLTRNSLYRTSDGCIRIFIPCFSDQEYSSFSLMAMVGQELWNGEGEIPQRVSFVCSRLSKTTDLYLDELLLLLEEEPILENKVEEQGHLVIDAPEEFVINAWFSKGRKSIQIRNKGNGPLALVIRSNNSALRVIQEHPNPHRLMQMIDFEFDPSLLKGEFGEAELEFETDSGIETRKVILRRAFWLKPVLVTIVLAIVLIWFLS